MKLLLDECVPRKLKNYLSIDNPLYCLDNTLMLFGDAKQFVGAIVRELGGH